MKPHREISSPYSEALRAYLTGHESALRRAREIGKAALDSGACASEMCAVHHESVGQMLGSLKGQEAIDAVSAAGAFLVESMAPFDANQHDLRRSNIALRYQNNKLESELRRLSHAVYDEALQCLAAARLGLAGSADESQPARGPSNEVASLLDRAEEHLTTCSAGLRPRVLEDLGLGPAIQTLSMRFSQATQLDVRAEAAIGPLRPEVGIALYRAVLEALTNVQQHARANRVRIRLCEECSVLQCSIRDDGVGFDVSRILCGTDDRGSGLLSISESLRSVGGTLVVESVPGGGTEVKISVCQRMQEEPENDQLGVRKRADRSGPW